MGRVTHSELPSLVWSKYPTIMLPAQTIIPGIGIQDPHRFIRGKPGGRCIQLGSDLTWKRQRGVRF
jgi:hypothetical protein